MAQFIGIVILLGMAAVLYLRTSIVIAHNEVGLVNKKFDPNLFRVKRAASGGQQVVLNGEPGWQADTLPPGRYYGYWPQIYEVRKVPRVTVPKGEIGLIYAKEGARRDPGRTLGHAVECNNFRDARAFLVNGGQQGRQIAFLPEGDHPINTQLFDVITSTNVDPSQLNPQLLRMTVIEVGQVGVVTTLDGQLIPTDGIGPKVPGHSHFENGQLFIDRGGCKGLQEEILPPGAYYLNPWFVQLELVPTYRIILDWSDDEKPKTNYDSQLKALKINSKDGYEIIIKITQVISIHGEDAPKMIFRVGSSRASGLESVVSTDAGELKYLAIRHLVTKELAPLIAAYFREAALRHEAREFYENSGERTRDAAEYIANALSAYGVQADETAINHIDLPPEIDMQIRRSKDAEMQITAHKKEAELAQQQARAINELKLEQQKYDSEIKRRDAENAVKIEKLQAEVTRLQIQLERERTLTVGNAQVEVSRQELQIEAEAIRSKGLAEAEATAAKVDALGSTDAFLQDHHITQLPHIKWPETWIGDTSLLGDAMMAKALGDSRGNHPSNNQFSNNQLLQLLALMNSETARLALRQVQSVSDNPTASDDDRQRVLMLLNQLGIVPGESSVLPADTLQDETDQPSSPKKTTRRQIPRR